MQPFIVLLQGEMEEIILRDRDQLVLIGSAIAAAIELGADGEHLDKLTHLNTALENKIDFPGTKAQLKPVYSKKHSGQERKLTKLTLVFKWGGEVSGPPDIIPEACSLAVGSSRIRQDISPGISERT